MAASPCAFGRKSPQYEWHRLAIALKASAPTCRVLLFSGYQNTEDLLHAAAEAGHVFEIISKPVHPTLLLNAVDSSLSDTPDQSPMELPEMN